MTGSTVSLGVESTKSQSESGSQANISPLRKSSHLRNEAKSKSTLRMSEKTWESRRIKEEMQEILSPTPLELHKVSIYHTSFIPRLLRLLNKHLNVDEYMISNEQVHTHTVHTYSIPFT